MTTVADTTTSPADADFTGTWRYKIGLFMIVGGNAAIVGAVLLGFMGLSATTVGTVVVGGEIVSLASIAFLGKDGFKAIKNKVIVFAKSSYTEPVSRTRHRIGIGMLLISVVTSYLMMIYAWDAFAIAAAEGPAARVWGLDIEQQGSLVFTVFLVGEICFLVSLYVLGADWWEKFRRIFVWEAPKN